MNHGNGDRAAIPAHRKIESAVRERYAAASHKSEACLCIPSGAYDPRYLKVLPQEIIERDYGCGDPSRWVRQGEIVLDLGSGGGKIGYICAQKVGPRGRVVGVDFNQPMLDLARKHQNSIGEALGYHNVAFRKAKIQDLRLDLDQFDRWLTRNPVRDADGYLRAQEHADTLRRERPMVADNSIDVIVSNCVLNLVKSNDKRQLFEEMFRVLKAGGRLGWWLIYHRGGAAEPWYEPLAIWHGGMSFHGGIVGVIAVLGLWSGAKRAPFWSIAASLALVAPVGLFFGRIANFINAELVGRPTNLPWGVIFPGDTIT
jgi:arsenite methyltransferase